MIDLGENTRQGTALAQDFEKARGSIFTQGALCFLPDAFRHQGIDLTIIDHLLHQDHGFIGDLEPVLSKTRGKPRDPQDAHRVLDKRRRDMAQHAVGQVVLAAERVDQTAGLILRDRIDGQVAPPQVVLERDLRVGVKTKPW